MASTNPMRPATAIDICRANAGTAKARRESDRAAMRARFLFAVAMVAELTAAGFKPRVLEMSEGGYEWQRNASR